MRANIIVLAMCGALAASLALGCEKSQNKKATGGTGGGADASGGLGGTLGSEGGSTTVTPGTGGATSVVRDGSVGATGGVMATGGAAGAMGGASGTSTGRGGTTSQGGQGGGGTGQVVTCSVDPKSPGPKCACDGSNCTCTPNPDQSSGGTCAFTCGSPAQP